ncbi:MAG: microviridin/marinostatin family tricyclic proteinase inhibitor [Firmicutes bacterium]|nr:microviridin/marinostatin family tricyclic proteinase inhibitor [Bacillota bacterium]
MADAPFFARYMESQNTSAGSDLTKKYPSDTDEAVTMKYPSDSDEYVTLKYPSDTDEPVKP